MHKKYLNNSAVFVTKKHSNLASEAHNDQDGRENARSSLLNHTSRASHYINDRNKLRSAVSRRRLLSSNQNE